MVYFFIFTISFITVYLSTPSIRYVALNFSVLDKKNHRKIHKKLIAKLGGLAIYLGFLAGLAILAVFNLPFFRSQFLEISGLVICSTVILMLGIYDDFQGSSAFIKFFIQITLALVLIHIGFRIERIFIPGLISIDTGSLSLPLTVLWLVGMTNAINLIDGLDGLASGIIAIGSLFFFMYGVFLKEDFIIFTSLALLGATLAFLRYNFYPARIFMGDTGSLFLGFLIASLAIYRSDPTSQNNLFLPPAIVVLFLPILDTVLAILRRLLRRQYVFAGDSSHIHHYYVKLGVSHSQVVKWFYLVTIFLGIASLSIIYAYLH